MLCYKVAGFPTCALPIYAVKLVQTTVNGMGDELVDFERSGRGLLRVFIDKPEGHFDKPRTGISVEDCPVVSKQLTRLFRGEKVEDR